MNIAIGATHDLTIISSDSQALKNSRFGTSLIPNPFLS